MKKTSLTIATIILVIVGIGLFPVFKVNAAVSGTAAFSSTETQKGDTYTFLVTGGPANTSGTLYKKTGSGDWMTTPSWLTTNSSGNVIKGPWTCANGIDDPAISVYIKWPDGSSTNGTTHHCNYSTSEAGQSTLTIKVTYGTVYRGNQANYFTSERDLTPGEASQISLRVLKMDAVLSSVAKTGVKPGDVLTLPPGTYAVIADSVPSGKTFTTLGAFGSSVNCLSPSVGGGKNTTCSAGLWDGTIVNAVKNPYGGATQGSTATIPQPTPSAISAQFQKVILDISTESAKMSLPGYSYTIYPTFIRDPRVYKYQGKNYLLTASGAASNYKIYVFDISQPLSPKLLKTTDVNLAGLTTYYANWITLDDYQYIVAFGKIFLFDSSGSLTFVKDAMSLACANYQVECSYADIASPLALFKEGSDVYLAAYARDYTTLYPNNDSNTEDGKYEELSNGNKRRIYTNAIFFYDVTKGLNKTFSKSAIVSGFRVETLVTSDVTESLRWPYRYFGHDPFGITISGKTYFVMEWYRDNHSRHSSSGHYSVVDVSNIENPQLVLKPDRLAETSAIFGHDQGLTALEKTYLNYESSYSTLIDLDNNKAVHWFTNYMASLGLFAPVFDSAIERENYSKLRLREIIVGEKLSGGSSPFIETDNTRTVLCEQIGGHEETDRCEIGTHTVSANFGQPIAFKNGVTISSNGKASIFSSSGFAFSDTSAQLFTPTIATSTTSAGVGTFTSSGLVGASLVQVDSKNFVAYVMTDKKMGVAKLTVSGALPSGNGGGGPDIQQPTKGTSAPTTFNFNSLLRIFRRILNK